MWLMRLPKNPYVAYIVIWNTLVLRPCYIYYDLSVVVFTIKPLFLTPSDTFWKIDKRFSFTCPEPALILVQHSIHCTYLVLAHWELMKLVRNHTSSWITIYSYWRWWFDACNIKFCIHTHSYHVNFGFCDIVKNVILLSKFCCIDFFATS